MAFLWSDAWLLQALALASQSAPANLEAVIAAADAVNHALPTDEEVHGAFVRLTEAGFLEEVAKGFMLGPAVPLEMRTAMVTSSLSAGRHAAEALLGAEPWSPETNVRDPRNEVRYPGLTDERLREADREYRRKARLRD
ncbi:MAG: hypothetical protein ACREOU_01110 [Candidatus Eiseniibacteriota bacterium]